MSLFGLGKFILHSGKHSNFKIDCDFLDEGDLACLSVLIVKSVGSFGKVVGISTGGDRLAKKLESWCTWKDSEIVLIVDDVLTTGRSMKEMRKKYPGAKGAVIFARGKCPKWVKPIFKLEI